MVKVKVRVRVKVKVKVNLHWIPVKFKCIESFTLLCLNLNAESNPNLKP